MPEKIAAKKATHDSDSESGQYSSEADASENKTSPGHDRQEGQDDGWEPRWDVGANAYYFYNRFTNITTWENPRVHPSKEAPPLPQQAPPDEEPIVRYNPAIHGNYDPDADYAKAYQSRSARLPTPPLPNRMEQAPNPQYTTAGFFNRFSGKFQAASIKAENMTYENKTLRQLSEYFDVDAAQNNHSGKSLKAERSGAKLSKRQVQAFKAKRKERKTERRKAWLAE